MKGYKRGVNLWAILAFIFCYDISATYAEDTDLEDTGEEIETPLKKPNDNVTLTLNNLTESFLSQDECYKNDRQFLACVRATNFILAYGPDVKSLKVWHLVPTANILPHSKTLLSAGELSIVEGNRDQLKKQIGIPLKSSETLIEFALLREIYNQTKTKQIDFSSIFNWIYLSPILNEGMVSQILIDATSVYLSIIHDAHTYVMASSAFNGAYNMKAAKKMKIGISPIKVKEQFFILTVNHESPAERMGLKVGDEIIAVDGMKVNKSSPSRLSMRLKGLDGITKIKVKRDDSFHTFSLTHEMVGSQQIYPVLAGDSSHIGYIRVDGFTYEICTDFEASVRDLEQESKAKNSKLEGLIVDLRRNGGGSLEEVNCLLGKFIGRGETLIFRNYLGDESPQEVISRDAKTIDYKTVVLTGPGTASASEIFSGVLQYYDSGLIVGEQTFGKATIQRSRDPLNEKLELPLKGKGIKFIETGEYYLMPNLQSIQQIGITPDIVSAETRTEEIIREQDYYTALDRPAEIFSASPKHKALAANVSTCMAAKAPTGKKKFIYDDKQIFAAIDALDCWHEILRSQQSTHIGVSDLPKVSIKLADR